MKEKRGLKAFSSPHLITSTFLFFFFLFKPKKTDHRIFCFYNFRFTNLELGKREQTLSRKIKKTFF